MAQSDLNSDAFEPETFPYLVLKRREAVQNNAATPDQVSDWQRLAAWLGCGEGPVTKADVDRLNEARLAFLRKANGSPFNAAHLPDPDICDIFERLSPAAAAIEKMVEQKKRQTAALPPGRGIDRGAGIGIGAVIAFAVVALLHWPHMTSTDPAEVGGNLGYAAGSALVPVGIAVVVLCFIKGSRVFRPLTDSLFIAGITAGLLILSALGAAHSSGTGDGTTDAASASAFVLAVVSALAIFILTAAVTGFLSLFARKPRPEA